MFNFMRRPPLRRLMLMKAIGGGGSWSTITGNPVQFTALASPLKSLSASFSPVQASGTPSPDNPLPISGWDGVEVWLTGKNMIDLSALATTNLIYENGVLSGAASDFDSAYGTKAKAIPFPVGASRLTLSLEAYTDGNSSTTGNGLVARFFYDDGSTSATIFLNSDTEYTAKTLTSTNGKRVYGVSLTYGSGNGNIWHIRNMMLNIGTTAETYTPYTGTSISLSFGSTLYSGTIDLLTGVVTVDMAEVDLGTLTWNIGNRNTENTGRIFYVTGLSVGGTTSLCSMFSKTSLTWESMHVNTYYLGATGALLVCADYSDKSAFTAAMSGVQLVYELATPMTIQLTPEQVSSLAGENVMWGTNNGNLTVEYRSA